MNRLFQLKETILPNILANLNYENLEFVILDYNSEDGMEEWVKANLGNYIDIGKVVYYKTLQPKVFNHSHAKNLAFKLASGDIVCNINADHFIGNDFAFYVNQQYCRDSDIVITPIPKFWSDGYSAPKDVFGKVCVKKADFMRIHGFDERMQTYGFEDFDFINRLEMSGIKRSILRDPVFLKYLSHNEARFSVDEFYETLDKILIQYIDYSSSNLIFMFNNGLFEMGKLIDHSCVNAHDFRYSHLKEDHRFEYSIEGSVWKPGIYFKDGNGDIIFSADSGDCFKMYNKLGFYECKSHDTIGRFYDLLDPIAREQVLDFHYLFKNRSLLELNIIRNEIQPNNNVFGKGVIYKNFSVDQVEVL